MKERIKGAFTKKKIFHVLKVALFVVALSLILLSLLGTVAHATGLVDDTNTENLYSEYPLSNYQAVSMWIIAGRDSVELAGRYRKIGAVQALLYH